MASNYQKSLYKDYENIMAQVNALAAELKVVRAEVAKRDEIIKEQQKQIEEQQKVLDELKNNLDPEDYEKVLKDMTGKFIPVDKKLQCGYLTMQELYHIPSYSNKVTTSMYSVDINSKRDEPIMGKGRYRITGQKIGEMELSVLLSRNAKQYIHAARKDTAREDNQIFLNNLLGLGLTVVDSNGYNQGGSSLKTDLNKMKTKFRLKNQK